jgi:hypothetical protein
VLASRGRVGTLRLVGLGCCAALWIPTSAQILQATTQSIAGFHARDVEMGRQLEALPAGSVVLVEGAAPDARSFQLRMMASYFGAKNPGLTMLGLGSTSSYITTFYVPEGLPEWRPQRAWTDVLATGPQPIETDRQRIWSNDYYALYAAPPLDVTPFGKGWYPPEDDGHVTFAWTAGDAELVISNQGSTARTARLRMRVASYGVPRRLSLAGGGAMVVRDLKADALTPVSMVLTLPAGSATPVSLTARPDAMRGPGGDTRQLMLRVQQVRIS